MKNKDAGGAPPVTGEMSPASRSNEWWHEAGGLASALGVPVRRARYLLAQSPPVVPGAKKVAGRWTGLVSRLRDMVADDAA
jgi:hypothetical protein